MVKNVDFIKVPTGTVPQLMVLFSCSKGAIYKALNLDSESQMARDIRRAALDQFKGVMAKKPKFV